MSNGKPKGNKYFWKFEEKKMQDVLMHMLQSDKFKTTMREIVSEIFEETFNDAIKNMCLSEKYSNSKNNNESWERSRNDIETTDDELSCINQETKRIPENLTEIETDGSKQESVKENLKVTEDELIATQKELEITKDNLKEIESKLTATQGELQNVQGNLKETEDKLIATQQEMKSMQETQKEIESKLAITKQEQENTQGTLKETENKLATTQQELKFTQETLKEKEGELADTKQELGSMQRTVKETKDKLVIMQQELTSTQGILKETEHELTDTQQELKSTQETLEEKMGELGDTTESLAEAKEVLRNKTEELVRKSQELETTSNHLKALTREFIETTEKYVGVYNLMCKCDSMKSFLDEYIGVSEERRLTISETIKLVNVIGNDFALARNVYMALDKYKNIHQECLTKEELACLKAINELYASRTINPCNYVVLDCLSLENGEQKDFKRKIMRDLKTPGCTDFAYATGVYVPALKTEDSNDYERKAIVKGD